MPFRRKSTRFSTRKRSYSKRKFARRTFKKRVFGAVQGMAEKKRFTQQVLNEEITDGGYRQFLCSIAGGAAEGQRIGRMIRVNGLVVKGVLRGTSTTATTASYVTMVLVRDTQTVGDAHAAISEIQGDTGTALAPFGLMNVANKGRFKILKRITVPVYSRNLEGSIKKIEFYYKFRKPYNVRYNGTADSDIEANDTFLYWISSNPTASDAIYLDCNARLWYTDL